MLSRLGLIEELHQKVEPCPTKRAPGCACVSCRLLQKLTGTKRPWESVYQELDTREEEEEDDTPIVKVRVRYHRLK